MGGAMIVLAVALSTLIWSDLGVRQVWFVLFVTVGFAAVGWVDDYRKVMLSNSAGLSAREKLIWQSLIAGVAVLAVYFTTTDQVQLTLTIPIFKDADIHLGWMFIPFAFLVIVGTSNAVNLTDGLDGLAILPTVMVAAGLGLISYLAGHAIFADYLHIPNVKGSGELTVFCSAMIGAGLGFLWFNTYPAQVFMGDVGALSLGAALGAISIMVRQELVLFIMGGIFVLEAVSVIVQVTSFKLTGKRVFRMAPIHHHFELKGWPEPRIIVRFWIITVILVLVGLSTLKLR